MIDPDDIANRYSLVKREDVKNALMNVAQSFDQLYQCEDGFTATYNEVKGKVVYSFKNNISQPLEATVTTEQRDYFVRCGYWRPI